MKLKFVFKRYRYFIIFFIVFLLICSSNKVIASTSILSIKFSLVQMLSVLPPIMIILGLIDVWISRESMMKLMGEKSGLLGIFISILIASFAAGPMYAAFPFASVLLKKDVKLSNVIIFMNAWCVIKISTLLFEIGGLGYKFTLFRLLIDLPGVIIMGYVVEYLSKNLNLNKKNGLFKN